MIVKRSSPVRAVSPDEFSDQRRTGPSGWKKYNGCKIITLEKYNPETHYWTATAVVYWKSAREKHLCFLNGPRDCFTDRTAASDYALALAVRWCDESIPAELIRAPR
jgi:hypothetical protein